MHLIEHLPIGLFSSFEILPCVFIANMAREFDKFSISIPVYGIL